MALQLNAATKWLQRTTDLINYNSAYAIMGWVRWGALTTFDTLWCLSDGTTNNRDILMLDTTSGNRLAVRVNAGGAQTTVTGTTTLSTGVWYHVALVRESATSVRVYLNGVSEGQNTRDVSTRAAISDMRVNLDQAGANSSQIDLAAMKAFTVSFSASEVVAERPFFRPMRIGSLYEYWPMLSNNRQRGYARGRDWTINGTVSDVAPPPIGWGGDIILMQYVPPAPLVITPGAVSAVGRSINPTPVLGSLSLSPLSSSAVGRTVNPDVRRGDIALTPQPASSVGRTIDPTPVRSSLSVSPTPSSAVGRTVNPDVRRGGLSLSPSPASAVGRTMPPVVVRGGLVLSPAVVAAIARTINPDVLGGGGLTISPAAASIVGRTFNPIVVRGGLILIPNPTSAVGRSVNPAVRLSTVIIVPTSAVAIGRSVNPLVVISGGGDSVVVLPVAVTTVGRSAGPLIVIVPATPEERRFDVPVDDRGYAVSFDDRGYSVPEDDRGYEVKGA